MDETNKLQNRPEPATCHTSGSYINTVLMGNVELTDHEPATNAPGKSPYTTLMKNRDSSVYASLEPKVRDKNQVKAPENGIIPTTTTKQRNFFLKLLVFLIVLVLAVGILASVLVFKAFAKEIRLDALEELYQSEKDTIDHLKARIAKLES